MDIPHATAKSLTSRGIARLRQHSDVIDAKETRCHYTRTGKYEAPSKMGTN